MSGASLSQCFSFHKGNVIRLRENLILMPFFGAEIFLESGFYHLSLLSPSLFGSRAALLSLLL